MTIPAGLREYAGLSKDCPLNATAATDCFDSPSLQYEWNMDDRGIILRGRVIKYQFPQRVGPKCSIPSGLSD